MMWFGIWLNKNFSNPSHNMLWHWKISWFLNIMTSQATPPQTFSAPRHSWAKANSLGMWTVINITTRSKGNDSLKWSSISGTIGSPYGDPTHSSLQMVQETPTKNDRLPKGSARLQILETFSESSSYMRILSHVTLCAQPPTSFKKGTQKCLRTFFPTKIHLFTRYHTELDTKQPYPGCFVGHQ